MGGAAKMTKLKMPGDGIAYEPPTELRVNAKKFKGFEAHKIGDKVHFSGEASVHHISAGPSHHEVTLHIKGLKKNG